MEGGRVGVEGRKGRKREGGRRGGGGEGRVQREERGKREHDSTLMENRIGKITEGSVVFILRNKCTQNGETYKGLGTFTFDLLHHVQSGAELFDYFYTAYTLSKQWLLCFS